LFNRILDKFSIALWSTLQNSKHYLLL